MEIFILTETFKLICTQVHTFPQGIGEAFDELYNNLSSPDKRHYFGLSWMDEQGKIVYKVAAEKLENDPLTDNNYETAVLPASEYLVLRLKNWQEHLDDIKTMFGQLLEDPRTDKTFPCVEWYRNDDEMWCMMLESKGS